MNGGSSKDGSSSEDEGNWEVYSKFEEKRDLLLARTGTEQRERKTSDVRRGRIRSSARVGGLLHSHSHGASQLSRKDSLPRQKQQSRNAHNRFRDDQLRANIAEGLEQLQRLAESDDDVSGEDMDMGVFTDMSNLNKSDPSEPTQAENTGSAAPYDTPIQQELTSEEKILFSSKTGNMPPTVSSHVTDTSISLNYTAQSGPMQKHHQNASYRTPTNRVLLSKTVSSKWSFGGMEMDDIWNTPASREKRRHSAGATGLPAKQTNPQVTSKAASYPRANRPNARDYVSSSQRSPGPFVEDDGDDFFQRFSSQGRSGRSTSATKSFSIKKGLSRKEVSLQPRSNRSKKPRTTVSSSHKVPLSKRLSASFVGYQCNYRVIPSEVSMSHDNTGVDIDTYEEEIQQAHSQETSTIHEISEDGQDTDRILCNSPPSFQYGGKLGASDLNANQYLHDKVASTTWALDEPVDTHTGKDNSKIEQSDEARRLLAADLIPDGMNISKSFHGGDKATSATAIQTSKGSNAGTTSGAGSNDALLAFPSQPIEDETCDPIYAERSAAAETAQVPDSTDEHTTPIVTPRKKRNPWLTRLQASADASSLKFSDEDTAPMSKSTERVRRRQQQMRSKGKISSRLQRIMHRQAAEKNIAMHTRSASNSLMPRLASSTATLSHERSGRKDGTCSLIVRIVQGRLFQGIYVALCSQSSRLPPSDHVNSASSLSSLAITGLLRSCFPTIEPIPNVNMERLCWVLFPAESQASLNLQAGKNVRMEVSNPLSLPGSIPVFSDVRFCLLTPEEARETIIEDGGTSEPNLFHHMDQNGAGQMNRTLLRIDDPIELVDDISSAGRVASLKGSTHDEIELTGNETIEFKEPQVSSSKSNAVPIASLRSYTDTRASVIVGLVQKVSLRGLDPRQKISKVMFLIRHCPLSKDHQLSHMIHISV